MSLPPGVVPTKPAIDEPPPFLTTWRRVYIGVLIYLVFVISALYTFTWYFSLQNSTFGHLR